MYCNGIWNFIKYWYNDDDCRRLETLSLNGIQDMQTEMMCIVWDALNNHNECLIENEHTFMEFNWYMVIYPIHKLIMLQYRFK